MGRKGWRVSRAFRVLLACLALWLPAQSASAWVAPADAVVMAARGVTTLVTEVRPSHTAARSGVHRADEARAARTRRSSSPPRSSRFVRHRPATAASVAAPPPLYLLHCALLR
jgi:hypothetical protein